MLRLRPSYEEMLREAKTKRLKIIPEKERRTQQGILLDDVNFDDFDLEQYDARQSLTKLRDAKNNAIEEDIKRTSEKGVQKYYRPFEDEEPNYKRFPWMYEKIDAEATTIDTMLYRNRDNINQTVRLMLKRNFYTPPSTPSDKPPSNKSSSPMSDVRDKRHPNLTSSESERESVINKSNSGIISRRESDDALVSPQSSEKRSEASNSPESVASIKESTPQPSSSSSSSSRSNNLPIESSQSENISVRSSLAPTIQHISSQSSAQTIDSRPSTIQYISD